MVLSWQPPETDWTVFDLTETVIFLRVTPDGTETSYSSVSALFEDGLGERLAGAGQVQMTPQTTRVHIRASTLAVKPARGDRIVSTSTANAGTYLVQQCDTEGAAYGSRYVCTVQKVVG